VTFNQDVTIFWSHSDNSGGLCLDSGIDKATGRFEYTGPNGYYEDLTPSATITESGGQVTFPVSRLVIGEYTIKISVSDVAGNTQTVTATVYVKDYPPTTPTITFSKNPVLLGEEFTYTAHSTDPDGDSIVKYYWQWQWPGETEPGPGWSTPTNSGTTSVSVPGNHIVYCRAWDEHGVRSERGSATLTVFAVEVLIDSYPEGNYDTYANLAPYPNAFDQGRGQAITLTNDSDISRIVFFLKRVNNPEGTLKAVIQPATGTVGTNAVPTGNPLAESNEVLCSNIPADNFGLVSFVFDPPYSVPAGDITFYLDTGEATFNGDDAIYFGCDSTGTHAGNYLGTTDGGTTWFSNSSMDAIFYLYES
jgi:hypothetical protein